MRARYISLGVVLGFALALALPSLADYAMRDSASVLHTVKTLTCDGKLCLQSVPTDSSGNAIAVATSANQDTANSALGTTGDTAYAGSGSSSIVAALKGIYSRLGSVGVTQSGSWTVTAVGGQVSTTSATIDQSSNQITSAIDLGTSRLARIAMPAAWTTASLTFQASYDCSTYNDLYDATGTEYTVTAAASRAIIIPYADFIGVRCLKIRSGTTGSPVTQGSSRTLNLVLVP